MIISDAGSALGYRTTPIGWVLRALVSAHLLAAVGQPVLAGVYLTGDFDALRWHAIGANLVSSIGYLQLAAGVAGWVRLRLAWPLWTTLVVVAAETVQYVAGSDGALWLHIPLGVMVVTAVVVQFLAAWRQPLRREPRDA